MPTLEIAHKKLDQARKAEEYYNALRTNIQLSGNNLKAVSYTHLDVYKRQCLRYGSIFFGL